MEFDTSSVWYMFAVQHPQEVVDHSELIRSCTNQYWLLSVSGPLNSSSSSAMCHRLLPAFSLPSVSGKLVRVYHWHDDANVTWYTLNLALVNHQNQTGLWVCTFAIELAQWSQQWTVIFRVSRISYWLIKTSILNILIYFKFSKSLIFIFSFQLDDILSEYRHTRTES